MAELVFDNITKVYENKVTAVNNFSLKVNDGEFVVFVGPSGCGKTTVLRMIAGLETITGGKLLIGDKVVNDLEPMKRDIAMVFQNYALYPHMTVFNNMAFPLKMRKMPKDEIKKKVENVAELLGITEYLNRKPKQLSGGQRQRVAIGRAIVREPQAFLMDEPLSNLDAKLRNQMRAELLKLHDQLKKTFVYVTHDQTEAMTLGDRIVIMKDGVIQQVGSPKDVYDCPKNKFVAGFIGAPQMNFYYGTSLDYNDGRFSYTLFGKKYFVADNSNNILNEKEIAPGKKTIIGIRPEHFDIAEEDGFEATIEISELLGAEFHIHFKTSDGKTGIARIDSNRDSQYSIGQKIRLKPRINEVQLFDAETEENILF